MKTGLSRPGRLVAGVALAALAACSGDDGGATESTSDGGTTAGPMTGATSGATTTASTAMTTASTTAATATTGGTTAGATETGATTGEPGCGGDVEPDGALVPTSHGPVQGALEDGVYRFLGVPYAAPPVGELRFRPPEDPACWDAPRDASELGPACVQLDSDGQQPNGAVVGEEDCLQLNVWTQETGPEDQVMKRPVMVFIHGGGNAIGTAVDPLYDGAILARDHDVVVVTLNYRLAALGFLTHDALAAESAEGVSGNYGTLDQLKALAWVKDNIAVFGGDPDDITLFGESAGAVNTCTLLGSPLAAGLLDRAIIQSGGCTHRSLASYEQQISAPWITASGCEGEADVPACLRALPADQLVQIEPTGFPNVAGFGQSFGPHVDGYALPQSALSAIESGAHNHVPVIVGANNEETANSVPPLTEATFNALVQATFGILGPDVVQQIQALYAFDKYGGDPTAAYVALSSDAKFVCGARRVARALADNQDEPVYRYHFAYNGYTVGMNQTATAFHGLELVYVFGTFSAVKFGPFDYTPNADDLEMAAIMQGAWTRYAAVDDPSEGGLMWPQYAGGGDAYTWLDVPSMTGDGVRTEECDFWDSLSP